MKNIKLLFIFIISIIETYSIYIVAQNPSKEDENFIRNLSVLIQYITLGFIPNGLAAVLVAFPADRFNIGRADFNQLLQTPLFYCLCFIINIIFYFFLFKIFGKVFRYFKSGIFGDK